MHACMHAVDARAPAHDATRTTALDCGLEGAQVVVRKHEVVDAKGLVGIEGVACPWCGVLERIDRHVLEGNNALQQRAR